MTNTLNSSDITKYDYYINDINDEFKELKKEFKYFISETLFYDVIKNEVNELIKNNEEIINKNIIFFIKDIHMKITEKIKALITLSNLKENHEYKFYNLFNKYLYVFGCLSILLEKYSNNLMETENNKQKYNDTFFYIFKNNNKDELDKLYNLLIDKYEEDELSKKMKNILYNNIPDENLLKVFNLCEDILICYFKSIYTLIKESKNNELAKNISENVSNNVNTYIKKLINKNTSYADKQVDESTIYELFTGKEFVNFKKNGYPIKKAHDMNFIFYYFMCNSLFPSIYYLKRKKEYLTLKVNFDVISHLFKDSKDSDYNSVFLDMLKKNNSNNDHTVTPNTISSILFSTVFSSVLSVYVSDKIAAKVLTDSGNMDKCILSFPVSIVLSIINLKIIGGDEIENYLLAIMTTMSLTCSLIAFGEKLSLNTALSASTTMGALSAQSIGVILTQSILASAGFAVIGGGLGYQSARWLPPLLRNLCTRIIQSNLTQRIADRLAIRLSPNLFRRIIQVRSRNQINPTNTSIELENIPTISGRISIESNVSNISSITRKRDVNNNETIIFDEEKIYNDGYVFVDKYKSLNYIEIHQNKKNNKKLININRFSSTNIIIIKSIEIKNELLILKNKFPNIPLSPHEIFTVDFFKRKFNIRDIDLDETTIYSLEMLSIYLNLIYGYKKVHDFPSMVNSNKFDYFNKIFIINIACKIILSSNGFANNDDFIKNKNIIDLLNFFSMCITFSNYDITYFIKDIKESFSKQLCKDDVKNKKLKEFSDALCKMIKKYDYFMIYFSNVLKIEEKMVLIQCLVKFLNIINNCVNNINKLSSYISISKNILLRFDHGEHTPSEIKKENEFYFTSHRKNIFIDTKENSDESDKSKEEIQQQNEIKTIPRTSLKDLLLRECIKLSTYCNDFMFIKRNSDDFSIESGWSESQPELSSDIDFYGTYDTLFIFKNYISYYIPDIFDGLMIRDLSLIDNIPFFKANLIMNNIDHIAMMIKDLTYVADDFY